MSNSARVLTGLIERRAMEAAFTTLGETSNVGQLAEQAQEIAQHGSAAIPVLLSLLDTADPQLRGGLGQVAIKLDAKDIVPALRNAARSHERSDQARLTALMILDRFLHEPVDESLLAGLQDPDTVAIQSLRELVHEMERNQFVVIEYLNQLAEQPADVAQTVLDAIPRLPANAHLVTLLRVFAQGENKGMAQAVLEQLSRVRSQEAAQALLSLTATLPTGLTALATRSLRKLRLSGVDVGAEISKAPWRALLSPVDGVGAQVVWFVSQADPGEHGILFSVLCRDPDGVAASFGSLDVPSADLPPVQALGSSYLLHQAADAPPIMLLEVPYAIGRRVVADALELNWANGRLPPMEYRLLNPLVWSTGPLAASDLGETPIEPDAVSSYTPWQLAALLDHPAFANWFWQAPQLYDAAQQLGRRPSLAARTAQIGALARAHFGMQLLTSYQRRLHNMARWFTLAAQPEVAALAQAVALQLAGEMAVGCPFVSRLIGMGLDAAVANLRSGYDLRRSTGATV